MMLAALILLLVTCVRLLASNADLDYDFFHLDEHDASGWNDHSHPHPHPSFQADCLDRVKAMFYFAYDSYMNHAYPEVRCHQLSYELPLNHAVTVMGNACLQGDLNPLTCTGSQFDLVKIPGLTLIDTLDTLVIMTNYTEFRRAVGLVNDLFQDFDLDVNVSVFETTIRVLGGLLSAHMFAVDEDLRIYVSFTGMMIVFVGVFVGVSLTRSYDD
jgi:hypothetical protein